MLALFNKSENSAIPPTDYPPKGGEKEVVWGYVCRFYLPYNTPNHFSENPIHMPQQFSNCIRLVLSEYI